MTARRDPHSHFERRLGRLMIVLTYVAVGFLAVGVILMVRAEVSPMAEAPPFDPRQVWSDLLTLQPDGYLWTGLLIVIVTPISRVAGAAVGYVQRREPIMALVSVAILAVIAISLALAIATS